MTAKLIPLKYESKCRTCGRTLGPSNNAYGWYDRSAPKGQKVQCNPCHVVENRTPNDDDDTPNEDVQNLLASQKVPRRTKVSPDKLTSFDSFGAFVDHCETSERVKGYKGEGSQRDASSWNGNVNLAGAIDLARKGWPEGRQDIATRIADIRARKAGTARREDYTLNMHGHFPEVGAFVSGSPLCMVETGGHGSVVPTSVVRITVQLMTPAITPEVQIRNFGAALCVLIETIEIRGDSVELIGAFDVQGKVKGKVRTNILRVMLKRAGQPLDVDRLCFMVAHPASMRCLAFKCMEAEPHCKPFVGDGYGSPTLRRGPVDGVCIQHGAMNGKTVDKALEYVTRCYDEHVEATP